ncbi:MAG: HD domain-containing protein [Candidatus Spechtbacterales bacterium]
MKLTPLIYKAIHEAARLHDGQTRKIIELPFIVHPFSVGFILAHYTDDEEVIAAGILHDTLEDVKGYEYRDLRANFGNRVADIVMNVTEYQDGSWREIRQFYLNTLRGGTTEAVMVSCADKIHNILSTIEGIEAKGEGFWGEFQGGRADYLWYYEEVLAIAKERLDSPIVQEFEGVLARAKETIFKNL